MINKDQVESLLKINGVQSNSPDEQIRSVLLSARYNKDEVDAAIMILRENTKTKQTRVDGLHKVFRTNEALQADEISSLLGIDVEVEGVAVPQSKARSFSQLQFFFVWVFSVAVALAAIVFYMHLYEVGIFHPTSQIQIQ